VSRCHLVPRSSERRQNDTSSGCRPASLQAFPGRPPRRRHRTRRPQHPPCIRKMAIDQQILMVIFSSEKPASTAPRSTAPGPTPRSAKNSRTGSTPYARPETRPTPATPRSTGKKTRSKPSANASPATAPPSPSSPASGPPPYPASQPSTTRSPASAAKPPPPASGCSPPPHNAANPGKRRDPHHTRKTESPHRYPPSYAGTTNRNRTSNTTRTQPNTLSAERNPALRQ